MKDFIYSEKFDKFLKGKLGDGEKLRLEEAMKQDPLLRNEINLQQEIFKALRDERKMLLKSRLDEVPVNTATWLNLTGIQWAAILGSMLLISAGVYYSNFYTSLNSNAPQVNLVDSTPLIFDDSAVPVVPSPEQNEGIYSLPDEADKVNDFSADISTQEKADRPVFKSDENEETQPSLPDNIKRPEVLSDFSDENQDINYNDFEAPDKALLEKSDKSVSEITIETMTDTDYPFHYQMMDQKLYLYGDFNGIPYKIIALNHDQHRQLFLKYEDDFYMLNQLQRKIIPLEKINDSTIIRALKKLND
jgi:hypothetical protein